MYDIDKYPYIYIYIFQHLIGGLEHFYFFHNIWDNPSHWRTPSFFKMVKTSNQLHTYLKAYPLVNSQLGPENSQQF